MEFRKAKTVSLKSHASLDEKWLQRMLGADPSLLGLGDSLVLKDAERVQPRAGRLDLLFSDPGSNTRYEVEVQLGATDEAHIIRTIEYWDLERGRYPTYEHVAVLVAEDITSRFLNVISLFNKSIPIIAIQMRALEIGDYTTLHATTVLNLMHLGTDEEDEPSQSTDRAYWTTRGWSGTLHVADRLLDMINDIVGSGMTLKYNKYYIGLARGGVADNFMTFRSRRNDANIEFRIPRSEELTARIEQAGIEQLPYTRWGTYRLNLTEADLSSHHELLQELIRRASDTPADTADA